MVGADGQSNSLLADQLFDLENSPLARRGWQQLVTVFVEVKRTRPMFASYESCNVDQGGRTETSTAEECDGKIRGIIFALKQVNFPVVESPSLD